MAGTTLETSGLNLLDLEHERKRVRSLVRSPEGRQALHLELGLRFPEHVTRVEPKVQVPVIAVLVPSRENLKPQTYKGFEEMVTACRGQAVVKPLPSISASVVHWVRNDLMISLKKTGMHYDWVLLMDDDIVPAADSLLKLLAHDKPIVAGGCTVRQDPPMPNFKVYFPDEYNYRTAKEWGSDGLMECGGIGTGFMLVKREVWDDVGEYYLSCRHEREFFGMNDEVAKRIEEVRRKTAEKTMNQWWFEFLKQPLGEGEFGEDISFCFKAMRCGHKIFVDTSVRPGHVGTYAYSLNDYCGPIKGREEDAACPSE